MKMKMKQKHYDEMRKAILNIITIITPAGVRGYYLKEIKFNPDVHDEKVRLMYDLLRTWASSGRLKWYDELNEYGITDAHIKTALLKLYKENVRELLDIKEDTK